MAKILKCPRCQEKIDVTDLSGGSTVKCDSCGTMVRLPSGATGRVPAAAPPPPPPPPAPARKERGTTKVRKAGGGSPGAGRQTDLFRKMSNVKGPGEGGRPRGGGQKEAGGGSNTGMIIAIAAAAIVVIGGVAFAVMKSGGDHAATKASGGESTGGAVPKKKKKEEPKTPRVSQPLPPSDTGVFKPGARAMAGVGKDVPDMKCNPESKATFEGLVSGGKVAEVVGQDYTWITFIIDGLLSDNEAVAKGSMEAMHEVIMKRKLDARMSDLSKQSVIGGFNMPEMRSGEYTYWAQWYFTLSARQAIASWAEGAGAGGGGDPATPKVAPGNAATENWMETLRACKSGGFTNSANESYYHFLRVKTMGKAAYAPLVSFIDNEDTGLGTAAVLILKELSGRSEANGRVTEANKATIKADWEGWLKSGP